MSIKCNNCGEIIVDSRLIACPKCKAPLSNDKINSISVSSEQEKAIINALVKRLLKYVFGGFSVLTIISVLTILWKTPDLYYDAVEKVEEFLVARINQEFEDPRIKETVYTVATNEASTILKEQIEPILEESIEKSSQMLKEIEESRNRVSVLENEIEKLAAQTAPPILNVYTTTTEKSDKGFTYKVKFKPTKNKPLGQILFVVKVLSSDTSIVDFWPDARKGPAFASGKDSKKIAEDGKSARLIYSLMGAGFPVVDITLSKQAPIEIWGNYIPERIKISNED